MSKVDPPRAQGNREMVMARVEVVRKGNAPRETVTIEWRGHQKSIDVIDMPVDALYYNPETHRVRAQKTLDPAKAEALESSPWSQSSQSYLHQLLAGDPGDPRKRDPRFEDLREDLKANGQTDPGIITPSGILVNGNTRRAALKENGAQSIRVGVLDEDWGWEDISSVELSLQLRKDLKRDYSFINYLLAVEEQLASGRPEADVAKEFRQKPSTIARAQWILAFIRDAIARSLTQVDGHSAQLRLIDFEGHQGKLEELYRTYTKVEATDSIGAAKLREARLVAMIIDKAKTDNRLIDSAFYEDYLNPRLPPGLVPAPGADQSEGLAIPGLDISVASSPQAVAEVRGLADTILQALAMTKAESFDHAHAKAAAKVVDDVSDSMEKSLDAAGRTSRLKRVKQAAPDRLQTAAEEINQCTSDVTAARASTGLDEDALDDAATALRAALRGLAEQLQRTVKEPGPGLEWILAAATVES